MKTLRFLIIGMLLFFAGSVQAQISVQINLGTPPQWGPTGYSDVRYYYLPDVEAYYDISTSRFIYFNGISWVHRQYLPSRYRNYDLYNGYKVVMNDYHGNSPYTHFREHKTKYAKGFRGQPQKTYGQRSDRENSKERVHIKSHSNQEPGKSSNFGNKHEKNSNKGGKHGQGNGKKK